MQLIQAMQTYRGIGILVSHDRELLDAVVTRCVSFEDGKIIVRPGGYTAAHTQEMLERETTRREAHTARKQLARLSEEKETHEHMKQTAHRPADQNGISILKIAPRRQKLTSPFLLDKMAREASFPLSLMPD